MTNTNSSESSDYQAFLNSKAERFKTPQELIDKVVTETTQEEPVSTERLIHGEVNEVYKISTNSQKLILRIAHATGERAAKERWAIEQSAAAGVPVPVVLSLTTLDTEDGPRTFCIQKQIEGVPLDQMDSTLDTETKKQITVEAGSYLHRINSVPTERYGIIDEKGIGEFATVQESLTEWSRDPERLVEIAKIIEIDELNMTKALEILEEVAKDYEYNESHLLHKDYSTKHFLIKDNHINGIIDFENAKAGDPIEEFARWHYYFNDEYPLEWLLEGYPDKSRINIPDFEKLLHAWRLNFGLGVLDYYVEDNNIGGMNHAKKELLKDLAYFDTLKSLN